MYRIKSKLAMSMLASIFIVLMLVFLISEQIAYVSFANVLFDRYAESAYRTAMTGVSYIDASKLEEYIETEGSGEDYKMILEDMQTLCDTQNVTMIYVIIPSSDYKSITNVLSTVNSNYSYECWPVGYHKLTTNVDYENGYRQLFEKKVDSVTVIRNKGFLVTGSHITELVPVEYDGKVTGILCVEKPMNELDKIKRSFASVTGKAMLAFILVLTFSYGIFLHKRILKPLSIITEEAERFARETSAPEKPLCSLIKNTDEIGVLARSIDKMTADTLENLKRITNDAVERESAKTQLDVARRIQYGIVPAQTHIPGGRFEVFALSDPARSVGGDFYDCFRVDNGKICVAVGDVSGKGIGAALFMATTKTMLRDHLREGLDPASTLNTVNDSLCALNPEELFVTAFVAVLEIKTGRLVYANAGHTRPLIISENAVFRDVEPGIALGLFENSAIENQELMLKKGQGIFIYTDGVTEAVNADKEFFGEQRLIEILKGITNAKDVGIAVKNSVTNFSAGCEQFDDLTLLALFYTGSTDISLSAEFSSFARVKDAIDDLCDDKEKRMMIKLACEEIFSNIINYSGANNIDFHCDCKDDDIFISFTDNGVEFDPTAVEEQQKEFEDFDMGGIGIMLVGKIAKTLAYKRLEDKNVFEMIF